MTTAPRIERTAMPSRPWTGLRRGLLRLTTWPRADVDAEGAPWRGAARRRRRVLLLLLAFTAVCVAALAAPDLPLPQHVLQTLLLSWIALGVLTALMGAWVMLHGDAHGLALRDPHVPIDATARTALIMPICNEDIATVFGGLCATCESLAATGGLSLFDVYVLSDTTDPALRAAELQAWQRLRDVLGDAAVDAGGRIFYRWRRRRRGRKAGNVADFCRRWGRRYRYMVVLDADSTLGGDTLLALVRLMEQHPRAGIVQTLPQAGGHPTLHVRLQQFAGRITGRLFALGMAYWQLGDAHYWGHNAILRVAPFMQACGLAALPGRGGRGTEILSHDFVEAALMRRAGYEVWLAPQLGGSWEQQPPNLLAELQRDRRWCQGNLLNARLIAEPGWQAAHRAMFAVGALSYVVAPLWLAFVATGLYLGPPAAARASTWTLWLLTGALLLLPRGLGVAAVFIAGEQRHYGGTVRLLAGATLEATIAAVQAPLRMLAHCQFVVGALSGLRLDWKSPPRDAARVGWRDATARVGLLTLPALALLPIATASSGHHVDWRLAPLWLALALAVPLTVATGSAAAGRSMRRLGLLITPEERQPPRPLARAAEATGFGALQPAPAVTRTPAVFRPTFGAARAGVAFGIGLLVLLGLSPRSGLAPGVSLEPRPRWQAPATADEGRATIALSRPLHSQPPPPTARQRPARRIDDDVRRRAMLAVERALGREDYERLIWTLASAAAKAP